MNKHKDRPKAMLLFQTAFDDAPPDSRLRRLAQRELEQLKSPSDPG